MSFLNFPEGIEATESIPGLVRLDSDNEISPFAPGESVTSPAASQATNSGAAESTEQAVERTTATAADTEESNTEDNDWNGGENNSNNDRPGQNPATIRDRLVGMTFPPRPLAIRDPPGTYRRHSRLWNDSDNDYEAIRTRRPIAPRAGPGRESATYPIAEELPVQEIPATINIRRHVIRGERLRELSETGPIPISPRIRDSLSEISALLGERRTLSTAAPSSTAQRIATTGTQTSRYAELFNSTAPSIFGGRTNLPYVPMPGIESLSEPGTPVADPTSADASVAAAANPTSNSNVEANTEATSTPTADTNADSSAGPRPSISIDEETEMNTRRNRRRQRFSGITFNDTPSSTRFTLHHPPAPIATHLSSSIPANPALHLRRGHAELRDFLSDLHYVSNSLSNLSNVFPICPYIGPTLPDGLDRILRRLRDPMDYVGTREVEHEFQRARIVAVAEREYVNADWERHLAFEAQLGELGREIALLVRTGREGLRRAERAGREVEWAEEGVAAGEEARVMVRREALRMLGALVGLVTGMGVWVWQVLWVERDRTLAGTTAASLFAGWAVHRFMVVMGWLEVLGFEGRKGAGRFPGSGKD